MVEFNHLELKKYLVNVLKNLKWKCVKKAKKLLKLTLDDGESGRTVVSGIAPWYKTEDLVGHSVVVVANLAPAKLCGVESQGMIIAADCGENDVKVIFVDGMPSGAKIR